MKSKLLREEWIGKKVKVVPNNPQEKEFEGIIIDETKLTFTLDIEGKEKQVPKSDRVWCFNNHCVNGSNLLGRPEDRIKK